ncbi:MAG: hypothetical protein ACLUDU_12290 [Butyricimonas faecihominis]
MAKDSDPYLIWISGNHTSNKPRVRLQRVGILTGFTERSLTLRLAALPGDEDG